MQSQNVLHGMKYASTGAVTHEDEELGVVQEQGKGANQGLFSTLKKEVRPKSSSDPASAWAVHQRGKSAKTFYKSSKDLE